MPIMPERLAKTPGTTQITEMVGSGPYRFVANERVPGSRAVYTKFDAYTPRAEPPSFLAGAKIAHIPRIEWHTIPDAATAAAALRSGEVDWWEQPTIDLLPQLRSAPGITAAVTDEGGNMGILRLNHLVPPFDNPAIRRVILKAANQDRLHDRRRRRGQNPLPRQCRRLHPQHPARHRRRARRSNRPAKDYKPSSSKN